MSEWIEWEWTPEKPYPETLETEVYVRLRDMGERTDTAWTVDQWGGDSMCSNWNHKEKSRADIIAYRVVK